KVPFVLLSREFAAEDITIEFTNALPILSWNNDRRMISKNYLGHNRSSSSASIAYFVFIAKTFGCGPARHIFFNVCDCSSRHDPSLLHRSSGLDRHGPLKEQ